MLSACASVLWRGGWRKGARRAVGSLLLQRGDAPHHPTRPGGDQCVRSKRRRLTQFTLFSLSENFVHRVEFHVTRCTLFSLGGANRAPGGANRAPGRANRAPGGANRTLGDRKSTRLNS